MKRRSFLFGLLGAPLAAKTADAHVKIPLRYVDDLPVKYAASEMNAVHSEFERTMSEYLKSDTLSRQVEANNALMKRLTEKG